MEPQLSLNWGYTAPPGMGRHEELVIRATAYILAPTSGAYTFFLSVDDAMRFFVDDQLLGSSTCCGKKEPFTVTLSQGYHKLMYQQVNTGGPGYATVWWDAGVVRSCNPHGH